jgi:CIC family chloride channel protein
MTENPANGPAGGPASPADNPAGGPAAPASGPANGRVRVPSPLIPWRMPSGRGATEQPNATGDGDAPLTFRFWVVVVLTGVVAGLFGAFLMLLLFNIQYVAFDYHGGSLQTAAEHTGDVRRLTVLLAAGVIGGVAWYLLRRFMPGERTEIDDVVWQPGSRLSFRRSFLTSLISEVVVGLGASIGREAAPKLMGGASANLLAEWAHLSPGQKRLLMACGGGAGLAAVYNVPLGGALFTAEIMLGTITLPTILPALACSGIATVTAWLYLPSRLTYAGVPAYHLSLSLVVFSVIAGPLIGLIAVGYIRLIGWVTHYAFGGWKSIVAQIVAMGLIGVVGFGFPQLFGNGKDMADGAFTMGFAGNHAIWLLLALFMLKPLVTAAALGSGASGGLFTPTMSTGAVLGAAAGIAWSLLWPGSPYGAYALIVAAAMLGAAMQAPLTGLVLILELTGSGYSLMIPMIIATVLATVVARQLDGYSIYSARLRAGLGGGEPRPKERLLPRRHLLQRGHVPDGHLPVAGLQDPFGLAVLDEALSGRHPGVGEARDVTLRDLRDDDRAVRLTVGGRERQPVQHQGQPLRRLPGAQGEALVGLAHLADDGLDDRRGGGGVTLLEGLEVRAAYLHGRDLSGGDGGGGSRPVVEQRHLADQVPPLPRGQRRLKTTFRSHVHLDHAREQHVKGVARLALQHDNVFVVVMLTDPHGEQCRAIAIGQRRHEARRRPLVIVRQNNRPSSRRRDGWARQVDRARRVGRVHSGRYTQPFCQVC